MPTPREPLPGRLPGTYSRRTILRGAASAAGALSLAPLLAACGGGDDDDAASTPSTQGSTPGAAAMGGILRLGEKGGAAATDGLDPHFFSNTPGMTRDTQIYDNLTTWAPGDIMNLELKLAEEFEPNADGTLWTIRLRPDITFHHGKDLVADDLIFTLQRIWNPDNPGTQASTDVVDAANIRRIDDRTIEVPMTRGYNAFPYLFTGSLSSLLPTDYDPNDPKGTGPFMLVSFEPGVEAVLERNPDYWDGVPNVDQVVINYLADETAQVNALVAGQVDAISGLSISSVNAVESGGQRVRASIGKNALAFQMNCSMAPFDDPRVRQAMRLIPDREQMRSILFGDLGRVGNDLMSILDPIYDQDRPQREQDLDQARALLAEAGMSDLTVDLPTAPVYEGAEQLAEIFAEQAREAGVTINLQPTPVDEYRSIAPTSPLSQIRLTSGIYLQASVTRFTPGAGLNVTNFDDPEYLELLEQASASVDEEERNGLLQQMMDIDHDRGPYIIPIMSPTIDGYSNDVSGDHNSPATGPYGNYDLKNLAIEDE
ncbi:MAG: ABC transporter substrate-binding protein [Actinomycetota bacterium]|nr:ABC transporter substrate-binding protein [Actinomycetota bacterium]